MNTMENDQIYWQTNAPGATYSGQVYKHTNRLRSNEYNFTIQLIHEVDTAGYAKARITEISDKIFGEIDRSVPWLGPMTENQQL